jgi:Uma2 family endonuclease
MAEQPEYLKRPSRRTGDEGRRREAIMSAIAPTMPTLPAPEPGWIPSPLYRMTVDQYEAMAASGAIPTSHRVHLINGCLVTKMTQKPPHVVADDLLGAELARVVPQRYYVRGAKPIRLPDRDSEPEPDRCVVRGRILDYAERHPGPDDIALVAEVADTSRLATDRKYATEVYGPAGIPIYWIVNLVDRQVEVYSEPGPAGYGSCAVHREGQSVPVVIGGRVRGRIAVKDILPPRRRKKPRADGA